MDANYLCRLKLLGHLVSLRSNCGSDLGGAIYVSCVHRMRWAVLYLHVVELGFLRNVFLIMFVRHELLYYNVHIGRINLCCISPSLTYVVQAPVCLGWAMLHLHYDHVLVSRYLHVIIGCSILQHPSICSFQCYP